MKNLRIKISLIAALSLLCLTDCSLERRLEKQRERAARKIEKLTLRHPDLIRIDTISDTILIAGDSAKGESNIVIVEPDSLLRMIDSLQRAGASVETIVETIAAHVSIAPVMDTGSIYELKIWVENGKLHYELSIPDQEVVAQVPCPTIAIEKQSNAEYLVKQVKRFWFWAVIIAAVAFILRMAMKFTPFPWS